MNSNRFAHKVALLLIAVFSFSSIFAQHLSQKDNEWRLVWSDEFNVNGRPDSRAWNYEHGFVRNHEAQWYQSDNAYCKDGCLVIEARKEKRHYANPNYRAMSGDWAAKRKKIEYTSASINTAGKQEFLYGRVEVRAKIPTRSGAWPAIWLLGSGVDWPSCGEIDIMEFYRIGDGNGVPHILANACWGTDRQWEAQWNSKAIPFSHFKAKDAKWAKRFHIWRMDWDEQSVRIYLDDELLNEIKQSEAVNGKLGGSVRQPFKRPMYLLLNLALGGDHGGKIRGGFPMRYLIDYVRVYQKVGNSTDSVRVNQSGL